MAYPVSFPKNKPLITLSHPKDHLWLIELHNGPDSRLTVDLVDRGLKPALDAVEDHWREKMRMAQKNKDKSGGKGALIIVGKRDQDKFFSNGLDFPSVITNPNFFTTTFNPLLHRLISFPIPTVAAINGHAFAGGLMLSLACDYRVMTDGSKRNAWVCMNEVHFGAVWPLSFAAVLRAKIGDGRLHRKIALEGHRFTSQEALAAGIVDQLVCGDTAAVLLAAEEVANSVAQGAQTGVWGLIKRDLYRDALATIQQDLRIMNAEIDDMAHRAKL